MKDRHEIAPLKAAANRWRNQTRDNDTKMWFHLLFKPDHLSSAGTGSDAGFSEAGARRGQQVGQTHFTLSISMEIEHCSMYRVQVADMFFVVLDFVLVGRCFEQLLSSCHP